MTDENGIILTELQYLQPSQLYVSRQKLTKVESMFDFSNPISITPIPVKDLDGLQVVTDGHTRALGAYLAGLPAVPTYADPDDLDWEAYRICVAWCHREGINNIADLAARVVSPEDYERLWYDRCQAMQTDLAKKRG
jgi:hypothetical protein